MEIVSCITEDRRVTVRGKVYMTETHLDGSQTMRPITFLAEVDLASLARMVETACRNQSAKSTDGPLRVRADFRQSPDFSGIYLSEADLK